MAVDILYDNGVPPLAPATPGWNGELLTYSETNGVVLLREKAVTVCLR